MQELEFGYGRLSNGYEYFSLDVGYHDDGLSDSLGFKYCIDSGKFGIIDARVIDEDLISAKILTLRHGVLSNKFSSFALARTMKFDDDFVIKSKDHCLDFGTFNIKY